MRLNNISSTHKELCPSCPSCEMKLGRHETVVAVAMPQLPQLPHPKIDKEQAPREEGGNLNIFTQIDSKKAKSAPVFSSIGGKPSLLPPEPPTLPKWIRPHIPGEVLDDTKERRCVSARCGAVLMRQEENDTSWSYKRYCCAACYSGQPSIPVEVTNENSH